MAYYSSSTLKDEMKTPLLLPRAVAREFLRQVKSNDFFAALVFGDKSVREEADCGPTHHYTARTKVSALTVPEWIRSKMFGNVNSTGWIITGRNRDRRL